MLRLIPRCLNSLESQNENRGYKACIPRMEFDISGACSCLLYTSEERKNLPFHKMLLQDELPLTIGGGIGQSRICLILLNKAHIGEVQVSQWSDAMREECEKHNIILL